MESIDNTILASIIGAIATVLAVIISPFIIQRVEKRKKNKFVPISTLADKELLYGRWLGYYDQKTGKEEFQTKYKVIMVFTQNSDDLSGVSDIWVFGEEKKPFKFYITNTVLEDRIFKSDYINKNIKALHFGTLFGKVSGDGKEINGKFLGYGINSERFVSGNILFIRDETYQC